MRGCYFIAVILSLSLIFLGCAQRGAMPPTIGKIERIIEVEASDSILDYSQQSLWSEEKFSEISANKAGFKDDFTIEFKQNLSAYRLEASNFEFSFDQETCSTRTKCYIHGAISKIGEARYLARFEWLLNPLRLDFIESSFNESEEGLAWEGSSNGISMTIDLKFPPRGSVYEAWQHHPNGHCHAHVWWEVSP